MANDSSSAEQIFTENYRAALSRAAGIIGDHHDAEEAVQDAGLELCEKEARGEEVSKPLFSGIVVRKALNAGRKRQRRRKLGEPESDFGTSSGGDSNIVPFLETVPDQETPQPDESMHLHDMDTLLTEMLQWLMGVSPARAEVFQFHKLNGHSQAESAKQIGETEEAVKQRWKKARLLLSTHFRKEYNNLFPHSR